MTEKRPERKIPVRSFAISGKAEKFAPLLLLLICTLSAEPLLNRPLWFDEALTVLNFALLETPDKIYHSYIIPNNQIVHTILLHWWIKLFSFDFLRLLPLLCGMSCLLFLWQLRRKSGNTAAFATLAILASSFPFTLYATALRGYMLSAAAVSGGAWMVVRYLESGRKGFLAGWFCFSLLGVGTMPGTIAGLAAAGLYAVGCCRREIFKKWRLYLAGVVPVAAFFLFYAPIWRDLRRCAGLGEGWHNGSSMLLALAMGTGFTFLPLMAAAFAGELRKHRRRLKMLHWLIWLLPVPAAYCFKVAPFPRVFFPMFPVFALLLAGGVKDFFALIRSRLGRKYVGNIAILLIAAGVCWGVVCRNEAVREKISALHPSPGGQEDFIDCHFVKSSFTPRETVTELKKRLPQGAEVYVSFGSDPWALIYAGMESGVNLNFRFDGPGGNFPGVPHYAVKHVDEDEKLPANRFNCRFRELFSNENHTILVREYE